MKFRMGSMTVEGANPIGHLLNRQIGNNIYYFRRNLFRERLASARNLYRKNLVAHYGCVNAIEFSSSGDLLVSGGDDRRVLLWKLEEAMAGIGEPQVMKNQHYSNIFCLSFNNDSTKIFSGGNDEAVIVHDSKTCEPCDVFLHTKPVYGLSVDVTNDQVFATAGEDGLVLMFDLRVGTHILALPKSRASYHAVQFHPSDGNTIITANEKDGAALWDLRDSKQPLIRYDGEKDFVQSCMSVRFNTHGTQVLALRRRLPPILYNTYCEDSICQFYHADYFNSCTMKSCSFAGDNDEYVISGSDDFNLYVWRVTDANTNKKNQWIDSHHMVLYGHRSIVNQVRYNPQKCLLASSGVEKIIKIWRPFELEDWTGSLVEDGPINTRDIFSHEEYISLSNSSQSMTHDYSHQNTQEDPRMMAFFDSLVQREIEGWNSNDNSDSDKSSVHSSDGSSRRTSTLQSESDETFQVYGRESANRNRTMIKSRSRYLNRIAYLIATKRSTLKRLALKGSTRTTRRVRSIKCSTRKLHRSSFRQPRKANGKRLNRMNSRTKSRDCNGNNSETELPKNLAKRRQQSHFNIPSYRVNRRVNKTQLHKTFYANCESGDSSSSDDENLSDSNNGTSSTALSKLNGSHDANSTNGRPNSNNDQNDSTTNFPIPSTSTGITGNGAHFRIVQTPDSDEQSDSSPVLSNMSLVPATKVNGVHSTNNTTAAAATAAAAAAAAAAAVVSASTASSAAGTTASHPAYSSGVDDDQPSERNSTRRKRRANSLTTANYLFTNYSSHSSSRLSNSSSSSCSDDDTSSDDMSSMPFFSNHLSKRSRKAENINEMRTASTTTNATMTMMTPTAVATSTNTPQTSSSSLRLERTPSRSGDRKDYDLDTPDSGIGSTPGSSR